MYIVTAEKSQRHIRSMHTKVFKKVTQFTRKDSLFIILSVLYVGSSEELFVSVCVQKTGVRVD